MRYWQCYGSWSIQYMLKVVCLKEMFRSLPSQPCFNLNADTATFLLVLSHGCYPTSPLNLPVALWNDTDFFIIFPEILSRLLYACLHSLLRADEVSGK
jgi:hypothetical protein